MSSAIAQVPAARPSRPSVRFTELAAPATTRKTIRKNGTTPISNSRSAIGTLSVVGIPTMSTATQTSPAAMTARAAIRHLPERPSERRLTTFMKSSTKPTAPQARVVNSTAIAAVLRVERITNGSVMASRMSRPPMVGVPCFSACPSGMSPRARTNWPTSFSRSQAMNLGPRKIRSIAAVMLPIRTRGTA